MERMVSNVEYLKIFILVGIRLGFHIKFNRLLVIIEISIRFASCVMGIEINFHKLFLFFVGYLDIRFPITLQKL